MQALCRLSLGLSLFAAPAFAAEDEVTEVTEVLILDMQTSALEPGEADVVNGRLAAVFSQAGARVTTTGDLKNLITLESDRAALCKESSESCMAEIAQAMGTRFLVYGQLHRVEGLILLQLNLFDGQTARSLRRGSVEGESIRDILQGVPTATDPLLLELGLSAPRGGMSPLLLSGGALVGVGVAAGVGFGLWSFALNGALEDKAGDPGTREFAHQQGWWVATSAIAGGVVAVAGGVLAVVGGME